MPFNFECQEKVKAGGKRESSLALPTILTNFQNFFLLLFGRMGSGEHDL